MKGGDRKGVTKKNEMDAERGEKRGKRKIGFSRPLRPQTEKGVEKKTPRKTIRTEKGEGSGLKEKITKTHSRGKVTNSKGGKREKCLEERKIRSFKKKKKEIQKKSQKSNLIVNTQRHKEARVAKTGVLTQEDQQKGRIGTKGKGHRYNGKTRKKVGPK